MNNLFSFLKKKNKCKVMKSIPKLWNSWPPVCSFYLNLNCSTNLRAKTMNETWRSSWDGLNEYNHIGIDHSEFWFFINGVSFCELAHNIYCLNRLHSKFFRLCWGFSWDKNLLTILCPFCICILYSVFRIKCLSWSLESSWSWTS